MLLTLATLFGFGLIHGLGPDHCLAVGALALHGSLRRAVSVALAFGLGHTLVLAVCALAALALGLTVPARWESVLESVGGVSLAALGLWTLFGRTGLDIPHVHLPGTPAHAHTAEVPPVRDGRHPALGSLAGAVFGLSGVRGLLLVLPLVVRRNAVLAMAGVALFGIGVMASMVGVGWLTGSAARFGSRMAGLLRTGLGAMSTLVGVYWVLDHVG